MGFSPPTKLLTQKLIAPVAVLPIARQEYLHVVYKEVNQEDGFVITAFIARKVNKRMIVWP